MSYLDIGFTENLLREETLPDQTQQLDPLQFDQFAPEFSGSKLTGLLQSQTGKLQVDLDNDVIIISDGVQERGRFGRQSDGTYGVIIRDKNGNILSGT